MLLHPDLTGECASTSATGYLTEGRKGMLRRVLKRANRMDFTFPGHDLDQLNETSPDKLFRHCRSKLSSSFYRQIQAAWYHICILRGHDFVLPNIKRIIKLLTFFPKCNRFNSSWVHNLPISKNAMKIVNRYNIFKSSCNQTKERRSKQKRYQTAGHIHYRPRTKARMTFFI